MRLKIRRALKPLSDQKRAAQMQAYMKSAMPFYGIPSPVLKKTVAPIIAANPIDDFETWTDTVLDIWRNAEMREERYAVLRLCEHRMYRDFHTMNALGMYEELIVTGAWWDYVDWIASGRLFQILGHAPAPMKKAMRKWARGSDMWKARSAILCQLKSKADIDLDLLYDCIEPSMESRAFFLRKAIGWALREHAKTDPAEVIRYVMLHEARLSGLSKREAMKHIDQPG